LTNLHHSELGGPVMMTDDLSCRLVVADFFGDIYSHYCGL